MGFSISRRKHYYAAGGLLAALGLVSLAVAFIVHEAKSSIVQVIEANGSVRDISVSWDGVLLSDVVINAKHGWPSEHSFKARSVKITPDWMALLDRRVDLLTIVVSNFEIIAWRNARGDLVPLPFQWTSDQSLREPLFVPKQISIGQLAFVDGSVHFYDSLPAHGFHHIPIVDVQAEIGPLTYFKDDNTGPFTRSKFEVKGSFPGSPNGKWIQKGWIAADSLALSMDLHLVDVPLRHFAPYLQQGSQIDFLGGRLGLNFHAEVTSHQINSHGQLILDSLTVTDDGLLPIFEREILLVIEDDDGRILFDFKVSGPLSAPKLEIEDDISIRFAGHLISALGIGVENFVGGVSRGVGEVGSVLMGRRD